MGNIDELIPFLTVENPRNDVKSLSLKSLLGLTGSKEGIALLISNPKLLQCFVQLTGDPLDVVAKDACHLLVNLSADETGAKKLLESCPISSEINGLLQLCIKQILDPASTMSDLFSHTLSNLTRPESLIEKICDDLIKINANFEKFVACFTKPDFNSEKQNLDYLAAIFSHISQCHKGRELICHRESRLIQRLLPFISYGKSLIRRQGIAGLMKNICFDSTLHEWLLSDDVNLLPIILLPLAGPEQLDDETNEKLPIELQYLDEDKKREEDPNIRIIILECLNQLCATKSGRENLRNRGTYEILRELHKFECSSSGNPKALAVCENVVDILIRTEEEIVEDNLKALEVPDHVIEKFEKLNTS